jgi:hypothetical protein
MPFVSLFPLVMRFRSFGGFMYGKIFASMYEGSMVGSGPVVFAVWGYCIAKADTDGTVLLNPAVLAPVIGTSRTDIETAIRYLTEPDPHSKNPDHEGRRLIHQSGHLFFVVSHEIYRAMKNNEDRRKYMREYMREVRASKDVNSLQVNSELTKVNPASASANTSTSAQEGGCKGETKATIKDDLYRADFEEAWKTYPDKSGKTKALEAYRKHRADGDKQSDILAGIERYRLYVTAKRANGQDLGWRNGQTFFNQANWRDEWVVAALPPVLAQTKQPADTQKVQVFKR